MLTQHHFLLTISLLLAEQAALILRSETWVNALLCPLLTGKPWTSHSNFPKPQVL